MIRSLAGHHLFLCMPAVVTPCHHLFPRTSSSIRLWHSAYSNVMHLTTGLWVMHCRQYKIEESATKAHYEMYDGTVCGWKCDRSLFIKFLFVTIRSSPCPHRINHGMVRSLTCHDPFLNMLAPVPGLTRSRVCHIRRWHGIRRRSHSMQAISFDNRAQSVIWHIAN